MQKQTTEGLLSLPDLVLQHNLLSHLPPHSKTMLMKVCKDLRNQLLRCSDPAPWATVQLQGKTTMESKDVVESLHRAAQQAAGRFALHLRQVHAPFPSSIWNPDIFMRVQSVFSSRYSALTILHLQSLRLSSLVPDVVALNCPNLTTLGLEDCLLAPSNLPVRQIPTRFPAEGTFQERCCYLDETFLQLDASEASSRMACGSTPSATVAGNTAATSHLLTCTKLEHLSIKSLRLEWSALLMHISDYVQADADAPQRGEQVVPALDVAAAGGVLPAACRQLLQVYTTWRSMWPHMKLLVLAQMFSEAHGVTHNPCAPVTSLQPGHHELGEAGRVSEESHVMCVASSGASDDRSCLMSSTEHGRQPSKALLKAIASIYDVVAHVKQAAEDTNRELSVSDPEVKQSGCEVSAAAQEGTAYHTKSATPGEQQADEAKSVRMNPLTTDSLQQLCTKEPNTIGPGSGYSLHSVNPLDGVDDAWRVEAVPTEQLCTCSGAAPNEVEKPKQHHSLRTWQWKLEDQDKHLPLSPVLTWLRMGKRMPSIQLSAARLPALEEWQITQDLPLQLLALPALKRLQVYGHEPGVTRAVQQAFAACSCYNHDKTRGSSHEMAQATQLTAGAALASGNAMQATHQQFTSSSQTPASNTAGDFHLHRFISHSFTCLTSLLVDQINDPCMESLLCLPHLHHVTGRFMLTRSFAAAPCKWKSLQLFMPFSTAGLTPQLYFDQMALLPLSGLQDPVHLVYLGLSMICCIHAIPEEDEAWDVDQEASDVQSRLVRLRAAAANIGTCKHGIRWVVGSVDGQRQDIAWAPVWSLSGLGRGSEALQTHGDVSRRNANRTQQEDEGIDVVVVHSPGTVFSQDEAQYLDEFLVLLAQGGVAVRRVALRTSQPAQRGFITAVFRSMVRCRMNDVKTVSLVGCSGLHRRALRWVLPALPGNVTTLKIRWSPSRTLDAQIKAIAASATRAITVAGVASPRSYASADTCLSSMQKLCKVNELVTVAADIDTERLHRDDVWSETTQWDDALADFPVDPGANLGQVDWGGDVEVNAQGSDDCSDSEDEGH